MDITEYKLKLNLDDLLGQLKDATDAFTQFGKTIRSNAGEATKDISKLQGLIDASRVNIQSLDASIDKSLKSSAKSVNSVSAGLRGFSTNTDSISKNLSDIKSNQGGSAAAKNSLKETSAQAAVLMKLATELSNRSSRSIQQIRDAEKRMDEKSLSISNYIKKEVQGVKAKVGGIFNAVPGGILSGGIVGGLIGAMVLGYTEKDRLKWWAGEVLNVFEATGESMKSTAARNAIGYYSAFQNQSHHMLGITKEEVQKTLKTAVDAGYKITDVHQKVGIKISGVYDDVAIATMALDAHFEQAQGTAMANIVKISQELGGTLDENTRKYYKLSFAAQNSGMGVAKYTDAVMSGASAMRQYGIELGTVSKVMQSVQSHYEKMGLSSQYSGSMAAKVVGGWASAFASMGDAQKAYLGEQITASRGTPLTGMDAIQWINDGFRRVAAGKDDELMQDLYRTIYNDLAKGGGDRSTMIKIAEANYGMDNAQAATLVDMKGEIVKANATKEESIEQLKQARDAFKTEGEKISDLEKLQFKLKTAIAQIGQGLIKVLVSLVGVLALLVKVVPALVSNLFNSDNLYKIAIEAGKHMDALSAHAAAGVSQISQGAELAAKALGDEFGDDFAPVAKVLDANFSQWATPFSEVEAKISREASNLWSEVEALFGAGKYSRKQKSMSQMIKEGGQADTQKGYQALEAEAQSLSSFLAQHGDDVNNEAQRMAMSRMRKIRDAIKSFNKSGQDVDYGLVNLAEDNMMGSLVDESGNPASWTQTSDATGLWGENTDDNPGGVIETRQPGSSFVSAEGERAAQQQPPGDAPL